MTSMSHVLVVCAVAVPVTAVWLAIVIELFRRQDLGRRARLGWLVFVLVLPVIGALLYVLVTWSQAGRSSHETASAPQEPDADLAQLDRMRQAGVISDVEHALGRRQMIGLPREAAEPTTEEAAS